MNFLQIYILVTILLSFTLGLCWKTSSFPNLLIKVILFITSMTGLFLLLESFGYLIKTI